MKEFAGYEIDVPFGPAAGVLNGPNKELLIENIHECLRSPVSIVPFGTITWEGFVGNETEYGVVYYHNSASGLTINSMGLPNIGFHEAITLYPELKKVAETYGKPLVPNISPGKGEDPSIVLPRMAEGFAEAGAPAIEVNYSSPNRVIGHGEREPMLSFYPEELEEIDEQIVSLVGSGVTIIRKLAPYVGDQRDLIPVVAEIFKRAGGDVWLNLSNSLGGQRLPNELGDPALSLPDNMGGLSGPSTAKMGCDQLKRFRAILPREIGIISCNGVWGGGEVFHRVHNLGADLTEGVTVYLENEKHGISYGETGQRVAEQYAEMLESSSGSW